jgi:hypothetical protein
MSNECFEMVETTWKTIPKKFLWVARDYGNTTLEWSTNELRLHGL